MGTVLFDTFHPQNVPMGTVLFDTFTICRAATERKNTPIRGAVTTKMCQTEPSPFDTSKDSRWIPGVFVNSSIKYDAIGSAYGVHSDHFNVAVDVQLFE